MKLLLYNLYDAATGEKILEDVRAGEIAKVFEIDSNHTQSLADKKEPYRGYVVEVSNSAVAYWFSRIRYQHIWTLDLIKEWLDMQKLFGIESRVP